MNSKLFKAGLMAASLLAAPLAAQAADIPTGKPYYKAAPHAFYNYYNWSGLYAGVNVGYGFGNSTWDPVYATSPKPKGFMYGLTAGYNWQSGSIVYGLEGDYDFGNVKGTANCVGGGLTCETANTWLATARGRVGYAFDRFLPYVTGGAAYGNIKGTFALPGVAEVSSSQSKLGYALGAGLEYAFLGNWSVKAEYLYVDLGKASFTTPLSDVSFKESIIRGGVNYKFNGPLSSRF